MKLCDCGACCDQCGHGQDCTGRQGAEPDDGGYSDYLAARAA